MNTYAIEVLLLLAAPVSVEGLLSQADMGKILAEQTFAQKIPDYKEDFPDFHLYFTNTVTDSVVVPAFEISNCSDWIPYGAFTVFFEVDVSCGEDLMKQYTSSIAFHASYDINFGAQYGTAKGNLTAVSNKVGIQFEAVVYPGGKLSSKSWNYIDMRPLDITLTGFGLGDWERELMNHYITQDFTDAYSAAILAAQATLIDKINAEGIGYYLCPT